MDSAGIVTPDVPARCFNGFFGYLAGNAHQVNGGVSGNDADADVSYRISIRGLLSFAGITSVDEYPG